MIDPPSFSGAPGAEVFRLFGAPKAIARTQALSACLRTRLLGLTKTARLGPKRPIALSYRGQPHLR